MWRYHHAPSDEKIIGHGVEEEGIHKITRVFKYIINSSKFITESGIESEETDTSLSRRRLVIVFLVEES